MGPSKMKRKNQYEQLANEQQTNYLALIEINFMQKQIKQSVFFYYLLCFCAFLFIVFVFNAL